MSKFGFRSIQRCIRMHRRSIVRKMANSFPGRGCDKTIYRHRMRTRTQTTMDLVDVVDISTATQWTSSSINNRRRRSADRLKNPVHIFEWDEIKSPRFIGGCFLGVNSENFENFRFKIVLFGGEICVLDFFYIQIRDISAISHRNYGSNAEQFSASNQICIHFCDRASSAQNKLILLHFTLRTFCFRVCLLSDSWH